MAYVKQHFCNIFFLKAVTQVIVSSAKLNFKDCSYLDPERLLISAFGCGQRAISVKKIHLASCLQ